MEPAKTRAVVVSGQQQRRAYIVLEIANYCELETTRDYCGKQPMMLTKCPLICGTCKDGSFSGLKRKQRHALTVLRTA